MSRHRILVNSQLLGHSLTFKLGGVSKVIDQVFSYLPVVSSHTLDPLQVNMTSEEKYDLTSSDGLLLYLEATPFASTAATRCSGGLGNFTFRIYLKTSYEGKDTLIVKHGKPYPPTDDTFPLPLSRQVR